jgi:hypothetical protein
MKKLAVPLVIALLAIGCDNDCPTCPDSPSAPTGTLEITFPNGGEYITQGNMVGITWKTTGDIDSVDIRVIALEANFGEDIIARNVPAKSGKFRWRANEVFGSYKIRISHDPGTNMISRDDIHDESDGAWYIVRR